MARKILIVDDQEDILLILEREFRKVPGLTAITTTKYADALSLVPEKQIDLVISDVRLGRDSGFDLIRQIRGAHPDVGTILMSAYRSASNRQQAEDLGVIMFLEKPFQISRLIQDLDAYFHQRENPPVPEPPAQTTPTGADKTGSLAHFKLQDLIQLFCLNGRNILITVTPANGGAQGEIYIQRGRVIHADFDVKTGEIAFHQLLQLQQPVLKIKDWTAPVPLTIETGWEHLLLQSAVEHDIRESQALPNPNQRMGSGGR